jgi:hypothetical protein
MVCYVTRKLCPGWFDDHHNDSSGGTSINLEVVAAVCAGGELNLPQLLPSCCPVL